MALNINTATADELKLLNGIKEKRAKIILEMREKTQNGLQADDLLAIPDLSTAIRNLLRGNQITFSPLHNVDLQTRPAASGLIKDEVEGVDLMGWTYSPTFGRGYASIRATTRYVRSTWG